MERRIERARTRVAVGIGPDRVDQSVLANVAPSERDRSPQQAEGHALRARGPNGSPGDLELEASERVDAHGPWPTLEMHGKHVGTQPPATHELLDVAVLDAGLQRVHRELREHALRHPEHVEARALATDRE